MKRDTFITREKLLELGWNFIHYFGYCEIYSKDKEYVLWSPREHKIVFSYTDDERIATL